MIVLLLLALLLCPVVLRAQEAPPLLPYTDAEAGYQLAYPPAWQLRPATAPDDGPSFAPLAPQAEAVVTVEVTARPATEKKRPAGATNADTLWLRRIRRLPVAQVLAFTRQQQKGYTELRYDYFYGAEAVGRTHVLGRVLRRGRRTFRVEYRAPTNQDARYLQEGRQVVESFGFPVAPAARAGTVARAADVAPARAGRDDKLYGIAAYRLYDGQRVDDCRTIHEFSLANPTARPRVHRRVLPFQSYALAQGFDNCLYSVTNALSDRPEYVYRYNPATREGGYTTWRLPAQGPETGWISAATDAQGNLYFLTGDANRLVRVNPADGSVTPLWDTDPTRLAPYFPAIGFEGAGTHANFCLDEETTLYMVYSTDGALLRVNLQNGRPAPDLLPIDNLPRRGGYSDILLQHDAAGRRSFYLAGPRALYKVDPQKRQARLLRQGTYTDLAGCNLFARPADSVGAPRPVAWRGQVLDAVSGQPLPLARLRIGAAGAEQPVPLTSTAAFAYAAAAGSTSAYHAQHPGYLNADSTWTAGPGPATHHILLHPLRIGATLQLRNVQFKQGQAVLLPISAPSLNKLVKLMTTNPSLTIELRGHTDNVGPPEKNVLLSEERVTAVKNYLVRHGIAASRITGIGLGGTEPAASNAYESTRRLNRRVEFRVTGM